MNNRLLISQLLRSPWFIDLNHGETYFELANKFLNNQEIGLNEKSIQLGIVSNGTYITKDYRNETPIAETFRNVEPNSTVIIPIQGALTKYDVCGWYGMQSLASLVDAAAKEDKVSNIILKIDSPGGSSDGTLDLNSAVANAALVKNVVAYVDGLCCSAGYLIASAANKIIAKPGSIVGSIGTMISLSFNDEYYNQMGIKKVDINATTSPDKNNDYLQAKIGNYKLIQDSILDPLNAQFINGVKQSRSNVDETALTGKVFISSTALNLGLIDQEALFNDVVNEYSNSNNKNSNNFNMTFGQKVKAYLRINDDAQQLTENHAQQLEQLVETNNQLQQKANNAENSLQEIKALFPNAENLIQSITDVKEKAEKFDAADAQNQHRLDKDNADGGSNSQEPTLEEKLNALPHHQKLVTNNFFN